MRIFTAAMSLCVLLVVCVPLLSAGQGIVINEIMFNPSAVTDARGEWMELYNPGDTAVSLRGWQVCDEGKDRFVITADLVIPPRGYVVLGRNGDPDANGGVFLDYIYKGMNLANTHDSIILMDTEGRRVDEVSYALPLFPMPVGCSIELVHPSLDNADGTNWAVAQHPFGAGDRGSPGTRNSSYEEQVQTAPFPFHPALLVFQRNNEEALRAYRERLDACARFVDHSVAGGSYPQEYVEAVALASSLFQEAAYLSVGETVLAARPYLERLDTALSACEAYGDMLPHMEEQGKTHRVLFCDNRGQYYHVGKAGLLCSLLRNMGYEVATLDRGLIDDRALSCVGLAILTNPSHPFEQSEIDALDTYLASGGRLLVTGQYYQHILADELNRITGTHGILFTHTEVLDDEQNTGRAYYPLITALDRKVFPDAVTEVHFASGCALVLEGAVPLLSCSPSSYVIDAEGIRCEGSDVPCVAAISSDGCVLAISSSTVITTSLFRGDNIQALHVMLCLLLGDT